jgi:ribosomal-protein-alanine N-acetyltransferase
VSRTRLLSLDDAPVLADVLRRNRTFLAPYEPYRAESYYTAEGQAEVVREALAQHERGASVPHAILDDTGAVVGRITLNTIVRGPFQSCSVGYWLSEDRTGRGLATQAVDEIVSLAFDTLGLHRVEAGTLVDNVASQRVLARTGFERIGLAPAYLKIAGRWQDHVLFQRINAGADRPPS